MIYSLLMDEELLKSQQNDKVIRIEDLNKKEFKDRIFILGNARGDF